MTDDIVARLKAGDEAAFEQLVSECERKVYNLALRYTNNRADAMDISQEVFLRVYRSIGKFKEECSIETWVYRIAVNMSIDFNRHRARHAEQSLTIGNNEESNIQHEVSDETYSPESAYGKTELKETLSKAIASLPKDHRNVLILRDIDGFTYSQIADILQLETGTVKSRIFRARSRLREILSGNFSHYSSSKGQKGGKTRG